jgi:YVTN family beta-propeller protein
MTRRQDRSQRRDTRRVWIGSATALAIAVATLIVPAGMATQAEAARVQPRTVSPTTTLAVIKTIPVADVAQPGGVAVNDADDTVYVTHDGPDEVSVINGQTGLVSATITLATNADPMSVGVDQADDTVYVANQGLGDVSAINGSTNTVARTPNMGNQPFGLAIDHVDDTVYVTLNGTPGTVRGINGRTYTRALPITAGSSPYMVAVDQADDTLYVTNFADNSVSVLNGRTNLPVTTIPVGGQPYGVAVNQNDDTVYVVNQQDDTVSVINGRTSMEVSTVGVGDGPTGVAVDQADDTVYVTNTTSDNVSVINGRTGQRTDDTITVGDEPLGVAVDDTGTNAGLVYVTNGGSDTVSVIGRVTPTLGPSCGSADDTATITLDVPQVAYEVDDSTVLRVKFGNNDATNLDDTTGDAWTMTVPAGSATVPVTVTFNGGRTASAGSFTYGCPTPPPPPPPPPPAYPPGAPTGVQAVAGDDTALVSWTPPTDTGGAPITSYLVLSNPRAGSCTATPPAASCIVTGLTNGTTYTFQVQASSIYGASALSSASNEVTPEVTPPPPPPPPTPTITITGIRDDKRIKVTGTTTNLTGETLRPWIRFPGQDSFFQGLAIITPKADGTFTWQRITGKKTTVYIAHEDTRSNTVIIPARSRPAR